MKAQNDELRQQLNAAQLSMIENREQRELDWQKFNVQEQNKVNLELAKLQVQGTKVDNDAILKQQEINIKAAESDMQKQQDTDDAYVQGMADALGV
jgi:hypothetical protein